MSRKLTSIVLCGALGFSAITTSCPIFAEDNFLEEYENNLEINEYEILLETQIMIQELEAKDLLIGNDNVQPMGKAKFALKPIKKFLADYWDDIPLLRKAKKVRSALMDALDYYFEYSDDVEGGIYKSLKDVFPNASDDVLWGTAKLINYLVFP